MSDPLTGEALFFNLRDITSVTAELHDSLEVDGGDLFNGYLPSPLLFVRAGCMARSLNHPVSIDSYGELV
jgi:hypothetical protein